MSEHSIAVERLKALRRAHSLTWEVIRLYDQDKFLTTYLKGKLHDIKADFEGWAAVEYTHRKKAEATQGKKARRPRGIK